jgi:hypothetical protein
MVNINVCITIQWINKYKLSMKQIITENMVQPMVPAKYISWYNLLVSH